MKDRFCHFASNLRAATVWATRSDTLACPGFSPSSAFGLGISTAGTGGGKYDPDDIRFQSLYRLSFRPSPNYPSVTPIHPGAPSIGFNLQPRLPYLPLRDVERLA